MILLQSEYGRTFVLNERSCFTLMLVAKQRHSDLQTSDSQSSGPTKLSVIVRRSNPKADQPLLIWLFVTGESRAELRIRRT
jgi:hypothetical protein